MRNWLGYFYVCETNQALKIKEKVNMSRTERCRSIQNRRQGDAKLERDRWRFSDLWSIMANGKPHGKLSINPRLSSQIRG